MTGQDERALPSVYRRAIARWGQPLGIQQARGRWAELVVAAEAGTITLIAREDERSNQEPGDWVALVPTRELTVPLEEFPLWSLREARPKLGELISAAGSWLRGPVPQVLTRHRRPVAALVAAIDLSFRADHGTRLDLDTTLRQGATVTVRYDPGTPGWVSEDGDGDPPEPGAFLAIAHDTDGAQVGRGVGDTAIEALLGLYQPRVSTELPADLYDEPPF